MIPALRTAVVASSSLRAGWLLAVLMTFWVAQLHGFAHRVSHLGRAHAVPHAALCADCIASASAGAAPTLALDATPPLATAVVPGAQTRPGALLAAADTAYRSRAPPTTA